MSKKIKRIIILVVATSFIALGVFCFFHSIHMPTWMTFPYDVTFLKGKVRIYKYLSEEKEINIPSKILGAQVINIYEDAFIDMKEDAVILNIPEEIINVERVYHYESKCYYILEKDCAAIIEYAGNESKVEIPREVWGRTVTKIRNSAFKNSDITDVQIPETVTYIEGDVFQGCSNLKHIVLPAKLEHIGVRAFSGSGLESIDLPKTIKEVGADAFSYTKIGEVVGLENIENIGNNPFKRTPWEECFDGDFFCIGDELHLYRGDNEEVIIPETIKKIKGAFAIEEDYSYPIKVKKIFIPDSVTTISEYSFSWQEGVEIYIPESVVSLGTGGAGNSSGRVRNIFNDKMAHKCEIITTKGSQAEAYAKKEKIPCRIITKEEMKQEMEAAKKRQENKS